MKKLLVVIFLVLGGAMLFGQTGVAINTDGTDPDANAILDVKSTDRGMLIPRTTISSLNGNTTGLLIFDTDSAAFFYYDGTSWEKIADQYQLGGSTNYAEFEADGTLVYNGSATTYEDLQIPGYTALKKESAPTDVAYKSFYLPRFDDGQEEQVFFTVQIPHSWKEGSTIYPHVHFVSQSSGGAGTDSTNAVSWGLEYVWASVNSSFPGTTTELTVLADSIKTDRHQVAGFGGIDGTGKKISSMLVCRLFREATDSYPDPVLLLQFDIHYEVNTAGSRSEWTK